MLRSRLALLLFAFFAVCLFCSVPILLWLSGYISITYDKSQNLSIHSTNKTEPAFHNKTFNLKLTKAEKRLHFSNIKFFTLSTDPQTGKSTYELWKPSLHELDNAKNVFEDKQNKTVITATQNDKGQRVLEGTVDDIHVREANGVTSPTDPIFGDLNEGNATLAYNQNASQPTKFVLELAVVLDKAAGNLLGRDKQKLHDFWTVHFYDVNLRFRTIPDTDISLKITSFIVIADEESQKFYEGTQNENGTYDSNLVLPNFTRWLIDTQRDKLPKFDAGILLSALPLTIAGASYVDSACTSNSAVLGQVDRSYLNVDLITHELGHLLGAYHDDDIEASGPGGSACKPHRGHSETGFVMGGNHKHRRFFFSECSYKRIHAYVTSDQAVCMRHLDEPNVPTISEVVDEKRIPTILEQCSAFMIENNGTNVKIGHRDNANCVNVKCRNKDTGYEDRFKPLDRSPCEYGRCFRGRCISDDMVTMRNVKTGKCLLTTDWFRSNDKPTVADCPQTLSPLEKYYWQLTGDGKGSFLKMPYSTLKGTQSEDKCLQLRNVEEGTIKHVRCSKNAAGTVWQFKIVDDAKYLIQEAQTKKCLKQVYYKVKALSDCDKNDKLFVWEFLVI